jgi:tryptophan-rich sensory protein
MEVYPGSSGCQIRQTAIFDPVGLAGLAYWYFIYPLHQIVFRGMLRGIVLAGGGQEPAIKTVWRPSRARQTACLLGILATCFTAAGSGAALTSTSVGNWYLTLAKPSWTPPEWLFGPVWTTLFFLMGTAAWFVWRQGGWSASRLPLFLFAVQLVLNVCWSAIFFVLLSPGWAFGEIVFLWFAIVATTVSFWGRSAAAALLMLPYLAWVTFAAVLNFAIWRMNS